MNPGMQAVEKGILERPDSSEGVNVPNCHSSTHVSLSPCQLTKAGHRSQNFATELFPAGFTTSHIAATGTRHSEKIPLLEEKHLQLVVNNSAQLLGYHILLPAEAILLGGSAADMHEAQHESDHRWTTDFLGVPRTPTERAQELKKIQEQ